MIRNIDKPRTEVIEGKLGMKGEENTALEVVNDFKYLGAYIINCHVDFKRCKGIGWSLVLEVSNSLQIKEDLIFIKIKSVWHPHPVNLFPQCWNLATTKVMKKEIVFFGTSCYRYVLRIGRSDKFRNEEVLRRVRRNNLRNLLYKLQLRSLGQSICKMTSSCILLFTLITT